MTTPNEDLIAKLRTSMGDLDCPNTYEFAMHQAADALQSQAERIVELEKLLQNGSEIIAGLFARAANMEAERDTLRVQLAEIAAAEPSMIYHGRCIIDCGDSGHQDVTMLKMIARETKLFTHPMPAQDVTELVDALEELIESTTGVDQVSVVNDARTALSKYKGAK